MATAAKWHEGTIRAFDTETTGVDTHEARIVTAAITTRQPDGRTSAIRWIIDPEVEIPAEAAAVHGWTNSRLSRAIPHAGYAIREVNGGRQTLPRDAALFEIAAQLGVAIHTRTPLVVHNASYDLTLLEVELARHDIDTLSSRPDGITGVVDPMVLDKAWDPYRKACYKAPGCRPAEDHHECGGCRKGKYACGGCGVTNRRLDSLCAHYSLTHGGAHDAAYDAIAAGELALKLAGLWAEIARWKLATLHQHQITWRREQSDSLRAFWTKQGDPRAAEVDSGWPLADSLGQLRGAA